jgi:hypothetical protein
LYTSALALSEVINLAETGGQCPLSKISLIS